MFRIGQKVECIYHLPLDKRRAGCSYPELGGIYTVRGHVHGTDGKERIRLVGIHNPIMRSLAGTMEFGFRADAFRPLVERKTDISVFTEILRKASKPARTPAMSQQERQ